jgi:hypothetical protein
MPIAEHDEATGRVSGRLEPRRGEPDGHQPLGSGQWLKPAEGAPSAAPSKELCVLLLYRFNRRPPIMSIGGVRAARVFAAAGSASEAAPSKTLRPVAIQIQSASADYVDRWNVGRAGVRGTRLGLCGGTLEKALRPVAIQIQSPSADYVDRWSAGRAGVRGTRLGLRGGNLVNTACPILRPVAIQIQSPSWGDPFG